MVNICRLCLSYVPDLPITVFNDSVSHETKIKCLIPEIDISITPTLDLCNLCLHLLSAAYTFKLGCIRTEDMIKAYLYQNENATINLQDVKEFRNCRIRDTNEILPQSNDIKIEIHEEDIIRNTVTTVENGLNIGFICNKCLSVLRSSRQRVNSINISKCILPQIHIHLQNVTNHLESHLD
ncbi:hypothetical protein QE152_g25422 [Popillia japonica]|uniref:ZAD domain-containing protein n=1 Tax=Popillia japonica TaxID=7064 RepID=A0AAW1K1H7_POPJA